MGATAEKAWLVLQKAADPKKKKKKWKNFDMTAIERVVDCDNMIDMLQKCECERLAQQLQNSWETTVDDTYDSRNRNRFYIVLFCR